MVLLVFGTGIGTSEVDMSLRPNAFFRKGQNILIKVDGQRPYGVKQGYHLVHNWADWTDDGYVISMLEYHRDLSMEERMTVCNMSIEEVRGWHGCPRPRRIIFASEFAQGL
jgi:homoaconitase/3-isopropylmalate dehydratase large subunit